MGDVAALVARQYTEFSYPAAIVDLDEAAKRPTVNAGDPSKLDALLWPEGRPRRDLSILVAGCGTNQAALIAHANRGCEVTGIDVSLSSLQHEKYLQDRHQLTNLRLFECDLMEVGRFNKKFDLIVCSGVLHHLEDPSAGLRALASVLSEDGVASLMVYSKNARAGLYMLQDAFQRMGLKPDAAGIAVVREVLEKLPPEHFARFYASRTRDATYDAGIVDAFLHAQDRAYTVPELLNWIEDCGLSFQRWIDNGIYYPDAHVSIPPSVGELLAKRADRDVWAVVDDLTHTSSRHLFTVCHPARAARIAAIQFDTGPLLDLVPVRYPIITEGRIGDQSALIRGRFAFQLSESGERLLKAIDGVRTTREILRDLGAEDQPHEHMAMLRSLWRRGHIFARSAEGDGAGGA